MAAGRGAQERRAVRGHLRKTTQRLRRMGEDFSAELDSLAALMEDDLAGANLEERVAEIERQIPGIERAIQTLIQSLAIALGVDLGEVEI